MTPQKLEEELERLHAESFAWALGCCRRDRSEAEDVLQEAYLKILEGRARFLERSSLKTFFFSVIRRTASEHRRRALWRRFLPLGGENDRPLREPLADEPPTDSVERRIFVGRALQALARRQQEVLTLVFAHGLTVEESAATLGISVGSARVHYQRGKARMAVLLRGER
jgi:RNA polymerase sigma-70 factor (ECF subfamily)